MSYGWFLDGFDSASAGFSVFDSFTVAAGATVNKSYTNDVLKYANTMRLHVTLDAGAPDYTLYDYPILVASLGAGGTATITGTGGSHAFDVLVLIQ